jgi:hypothetical protein
MKRLLLVTFGIVLAGCQSPMEQQHLAFSGGDGSSCQQAVVINDTKYRETGMVAERVWLNRKYPGHVGAQSREVAVGAKHYDLVELTTADGQAVKVYFDSTEFCGK